MRWLLTMKTVLLLVGLTFAYLLVMSAPHIYKWKSKPQRFDTEHLDLEVASLPARLNGTKIVFLTDIHAYKFGFAGAYAEMLQNITEAVNSEAADLVLLGGDIVDREHEAVAHAIPFISSLKAKSGIFGVLGNHDYFGSASYVSSALSKHIEMIDNIAIEPLGPGLQLVGLGDLWNNGFHPERVTNRNGERVKACLAPDSGARLVLMHHPDTATPFNHLGCVADLMVAGHTHGGQICLPSLMEFGGSFPVVLYLTKIRDMIPSWMHIILPARRLYHAMNNWEWASGLHTVVRSAEETRPSKFVKIDQFESGTRPTSHNRLYVSRGLADIHRRLCCRPEVTVITLLSPQNNMEHPTSEKEL